MEELDPKLNVRGTEPSPVLPEIVVHLRSLICGCGAV